MPLFRSPEGHNDGGYAISSYREVEPRLGTTEQLTTLAAELRALGSVWCSILCLTTHPTSTIGRCTP